MTYFQKRRMEPDMYKLRDASVNDPDLLDSEDDSLTDIECDLCQKHFSNVKSYEQHLKGNKHFKMITKMKLMQAAKNGKAEKSSAATHDDLEGDVTCNICSMRFSGYTPYVSHLNGNRHFKNVRRQRLEEDMKELPGVVNKDDLRSGNDDVVKKPFAECPPCNKVFHDPESFKKHLVGNTHKKKMLEVKTIKCLSSGRPPSSQDCEGKEFFNQCKLCNKSFSGPVPYKTHLDSPIHKKEIKRAEVTKELEDFYTTDQTNQKLICKQCNKPFTDPFALKLHLESKDHEKKKAKKDIYSVVSELPEITAVKSAQNNSTEDEKYKDEYHPVDSYFFVCHLCHLSFSGPESVRDHIKSKKHFTAMKEKRARKSFLDNPWPKTEEIDGNKRAGWKNSNGMLHEGNYATDKTIEKLIEEAAIDIDGFELI